jgi:hypothetical protein
VCRANWRRLCGRVAGSVVSSPVRGGFIAWLLAFHGPCDPSLLRRRSDPRSCLPEDRSARESWRATHFPWLDKPVGQGCESQTLGEPGLVGAIRDTSAQSCWVYDRHRLARGCGCASVRQPGSSARQRPQRANSRRLRIPAQGCPPCIRTELSGLERRRTTVRAVFLQRDRYHPDPQHQGFKVIEADAVMPSRVALIVPV